MLNSPTSESPTNEIKEMSEPTNYAPTPAQQADVLDAAIDLLEHDGWCQNALRLPSGERCATGSILEALDLLGAESDVRFGVNIYDNLCTTYAELLTLVVSELPPAYAPRIPLTAYALESVRTYRAHNAVVSFNNHPDTTAEDVIDLLRRAAKTARNEATP